MQFLTGVALNQYLHMQAYKIYLQHIYTYVKSVQALH